MKIIKYAMLVIIFVVALAYVDLKVNEMYSEPKIVIFEEIYKSVKGAWD